MRRSRPDLAERNRRNARHGATRDGDPTPTYRTWRAMRQRCGPTANAHDRPRYYDRGIRVCERWHAFENFLADMGPRPAGHTIERIDNERGYEPGNCVWARPLQQAHNRRSNRRITVNGESLTVAEWAERLGTSRQVIRHRLEAGWSHEAAVTLPPSKKENTRWRSHTFRSSSPQLQP